MSVALQEMASAITMTRSDIEAFLIEEAAMLDEHRFDDWFALFDEGATYKVPQAGADNDVMSGKTLFYIADDYFRLGQRVERMAKPDHHSEYPASTCSRMIGNVRILSAVDDKIEAECKYITHRSKNNVTDMYCGHHRYTFKIRDGKLRIGAKTTYIDMNDLRPQGRVSIII